MTNSNVTPMPEVRKPTLSNAMYDRMKFVAQILLPALGTLYFALADLWDLPKPTEVVGTIVAVDAFLGVLLGLSSRQYQSSEEKFDGMLAINENDSRIIHQLELTTAPFELGRKDAITLRVVKAPGELPE